MKAKNMIRRSLFASALALALPLLGRAEPAAPVLSCWTNLEIGTRSTWVSLTDHRRDFNATSVSMGSFYGSINQLNAIPNYWPLKPFVDYKFCPYGGVELAWDYFSVRTITRGDGHTDGDLNLMGPMLSVFVRCPTDFKLTPFAGAGLVYYKVDFSEDPDWHAPPGRPEIQTMDFDHTWGLFVYGGVIWNITDHVALDLYVRYTKVQDAEGTHWAGADGTFNNGSPTIPLSNIATSLGLRYCF